MGSSRRSDGRTKGGERKGSRSEGADGQTRRGRRRLRGLRGFVLQMRIIDRRVSSRRKELVISRRPLDDARLSLRQDGKRVARDGGSRGAMAALALSAARRPSPTAHARASPPRHHPRIACIGPVHRRTSSLVAPVPDSTSAASWTAPRSSPLPHAERRAVLREALERGSGSSSSQTSRASPPHPRRAVVRGGGRRGEEPRRRTRVPHPERTGGSGDRQRPGRTRALRAMFSRAPLPTDRITGAPTLRYDPSEIARVAHGPGVRDPPPFASLLYCVKSPPAGAGATPRSRT